GARGGGAAVGALKVRTVLEGDGRVAAAFGAGGERVARLGRGPAWGGGEQCQGGGGEQQGARCHHRWRRSICAAGAVRARAMFHYETSIDCVSLWRTFQIGAIRCGSASRLALK